MTGRPDQRPEDRLLHDLSPDLEAALSRPVEAPDMTRSIMGQLGYMRASRAAARRGRLRRWAARATTCVFGVAVLAIGLRVHDQSASARRPVGPTVPSAIGSQMTEQGRSIIRTLETIRQIAPAVPAVPETEPATAPFEVDLEGAVGPVC